MAGLEIIFDKYPVIVISKNKILAVIMYFTAVTHDLMYNSKLVSIMFETTTTRRYISKPRRQA